MWPVLAGVLGHLGLPWLLLAAGPRLGGRAGPVYDWGSLLCALPALALLGPQWSPHSPLWTVIVLLAAVAAGVALPLGAARLAARPLRPSWRALPAAEVLALPLCAAAEEVLWRAAAPALLAGLGLPWPVAAGVALAGFASLHLPLRGLRGLPYQLLSGALFTAAAAAGGLVAAIGCHLAHNLTLATAVPARPLAAAARALPATSDWD